MTNLWPFTGPALHQLFPVWPLTSNPHGDCGGSAGPRYTALCGESCAQPYVPSATSSSSSSSAALSG
ncbi:hypothetical protein CgunFtcFv8_007646 [Champsocephalus gunnari]|uniref:Uncharacterized protein n=1 Tax=Champsocephalus gunnari TaxID=52237 RepID=A0AAN8H5Y0_CHAGU|nr:hypothetical protein CgunFtcFv8_007646 [Champsocephalus gunnari]